jgi:hydroxypyruvate isomerase
MEPTMSTEPTVSTDADGYGLIANISLLFSDLPLLDRPAAAAQAGFEGVEAWWPWPQSAVPSVDEVNAFVEAISRSGIPLTGLNLFAGDMPGGQRGIVSDPARTDEFVANLDLVVRIAERTGCRGFNALYGQRQVGVDTNAQDQCARANLALAMHRLAEVDGTVLVEALSRGLNGAYPLETAADVITIVDAVRASTGRDNIGFLFDTFHLTNNDEDLVAVINRHAHLIAHVQLADAPGRGEPGTGTIDFDAVLDHLWQRGYNGLVACEYAPTIDSLAWTHRTTRVHSLQIK